MRGFVRLAALAIISALLAGGCKQKAEVPAPVVQPPQPVITPAPVVVPPEEPVIPAAVAKLEGSTTTTIKAQVSGYLIKQFYREGDAVKKGDVLFEIDPKAFHEPGANPDYLKVTSPIAGVADRATVGLGDRITIGMALTTVSTVDPINAEFALPAAFCHDHADWIAKIVAMPMESRPEDVQLVLEDGTVYPKLGKITYVQTEFARLTGIVTVIAAFSNPDGALKPGQFVKLRGVTAHQ